MSVHGSCCHIDLCVSDSMCVLCTSETKNFQYLFLNSHSQQHTTVHIPYTQHTHTQHTYTKHIYTTHTYTTHTYTTHTYTTHTYTTHTYTTHTTHIHNTHNTHTQHTQHTHTAYIHNTRTHNTHTCPCMHSTCFVLWIGTCLEPLSHSFRVLVYLLLQSVFASPKAIAL